MSAQWSDGRARAVLRGVFDAAVESARPEAVVRQHLPDKPRGRCIVVGAGKAAAAMAAGVDSAWPDVDVSGVVVTRYGHGGAAGRIAVLEAGHPVPDAAGVAASRRILDSVRGLKNDDLVLALISGGGSALLTAPAGGITLEEKRAITEALLRSGAPIRDMNVVRKHLSDVKGGRLAAAAAPAKVVTLVISDVPGDDPAVIASGPTVPDRSSPEQAQAILSRYGIPMSDSIREVLGRHPLTGLATDPERNETRIVAAPIMALEAAARVGAREGLATLVLGDAIEGESRDVGIVLAGITSAVRRHGIPLGPPALLLSGGETTVTLGGHPGGRGGRNTELLLSFAIAIDGLPSVWAMAGDTDGIDGTEDAAGAFLSPDTLTRARHLGLDASRALARHDSYAFFEAIGDLLKTGPTLTNVNDIRAILIA